MYSTIWAYLWDLCDDGIVESVRYLRNETGLDAISVATAYHTFQQLRPHRPGRKLITGDSAAVYFRPDSSLYSGTSIQPHVAPLARGSNPLQTLAGACANQGLDLIGWTVCLHTSQLARTYPRYAQQTAYGDNLGWILCPGEEEVRTYVTALCNDLVANYGIRRVELETCNYGGYGHSHYHTKDGVPLGTVGNYLHSLCFSPGCMDRAKQRGIDAGGLRSWVRRQLDQVFATGQPLEGEVPSFVEANPELAGFQEMREEAVTSLIGRIKEDSGAPEVSFLLMGDRWTSGIRPEKIAGVCDLLGSLAYTSSPEIVEERVKGDLERSGIEPRQLVVGLQAYPPAAADAETLAAVFARARECGAEQFSFYNYGIMPRPNLDWIRRCVRS